MAGIELQIKAGLNSERLWQNLLGTFKGPSLLLKKRGQAALNNSAASKPYRHFIQKSLPWWQRVFSSDRKIILKDLDPPQSPPINITLKQTSFWQRIFSKKSASFTLSIETPDQADFNNIALNLSDILNLIVNTPGAKIAGALVHSNHPQSAAYLFGSLINKGIENVGLDASTQGLLSQASLSTPRVTLRVSKEIESLSSSDLKKEKLRKLIRALNSGNFKSLQTYLNEPPYEGKPELIAKTFFAKIQLINKAKLGQYLASRDNTLILKAFMQNYPFKGLSFIAAMRLLLESFALPKEAQEIDRVMEAFGQRYSAENPNHGIFENIPQGINQDTRKRIAADAAYVLSYSVLMLNTELHNPNIPKDKKMTVEQFIKNNRGILGEKDIPAFMMKGFHQEIARLAFKFKEHSKPLELAPGIDEILLKRKAMVEAAGFHARLSTKAKTVARAYAPINPQIAALLPNKQPAPSHPLDNPKFADNSTKEAGKPKHWQKARLMLL